MTQTSVLRRVVLVVGGGGAIGSEIARTLARQGDTVAVADHDLAAARRSAEETGMPEVAYQVDAVEERSVMALFDSVEEKLGPISVLVDCVGGTRVGTNPPAFWETSLDVWTTTEALNARSGFILLKEFLRRRVRQQVTDGRAVLIGSIGGQVAHSRSGTAYAAAKAALQSIVRQAASEAGPFGITVNLVAPGPIDTPAFRATASQETCDRIAASGPVQRMGLPADIAHAVAFLAAPASSYITGATLDVNGGRRMQ